MLVCTLTSSAPVNTRHAQDH
uniref:Uncharacterized protein n=1 Tax=Anguilla anguilla TaxID=7936 RepID=A0A0E9SHL6_ANGAN